MDKRFVKRFRWVTVERKSIWILKHFLSHHYVHSTINMIEVGALPLKLKPEKICAFEFPSYDYFTVLAEKRQH